MSELRLALPTIFLHEGRYVNNIKDPGGATNYGISLRFLLQNGDLDKDGRLDGDIDRDGDVDIDDIKKMTLEDAAHLYDLYFWSRHGYSRVDDQAIATKVFDLAINMGSVGAHKCIQRALRAASNYKVAEDGVIGKESFKAINTSNPVKLLPSLKSEAAGYYRSIRLKGGNEKEFINGWLNRAYSDAIF
jgi:lysozyme family protein